MSDFDPVGTIAFFRERHSVESVTTGSALRAMPPESLSYAPHPASSTAGVTAWTIIRCLRVCTQLSQSNTAEVSQESHLDHDALVRAFVTESAKLAEKLLRLRQREWIEKRSVTSGGHLLLRQPLGQILWLFHVDAIHHRGQISTYLRGLGAKVPSIYGPSGDSQA
jgi:uncharacterized damage-inducible protein DinB